MPKGGPGKLCLECNLPIRSHCKGTLRHRECFRKFRAFDKKIYMKTWWVENKDKAPGYLKQYAKKVNKQCADCQADIVPQATYCKKCCYQHPELHGNWKGGITTNKKFYNKLLRAKECGEITIELIQMVFEDNIKKYGTLTCYLCLKPIEFGKDNLEHKIPKSRGGKNTYENLGIACNVCNGRKVNLTLKEYLTKEASH